MKNTVIEIGTGTDSEMIQVNDTNFEEVRSFLLTLKTFEKWTVTTQGTLTLNKVHMVSRYNKVLRTDILKTNNLSRPINNSYLIGTDLLEIWC